MGKKDIQDDGYFMPTKVGKTIYVWSRGAKKPVNDRSCVISAHGGEAVIASGLPKPVVPLFYYCPHGWGLKNPGLGPIATGRTKYYERVAPGAAGQDYRLTKYQGRHSDAGETYAVVQGVMPAEEARICAYFNREYDDWANLGLDDQLTAGLRGETQEKYEADRASLHEVIRDVVTIRDRANHKPPTLFEVCRSLIDAGFHYTDIHCSFCRVARSGKMGSWNPNAYNTFDGQRPNAPPDQDPGDA